MNLEALWGLRLAAWQNDPKLQQHRHPFADALFAAMGVASKEELIRLELAFPFATKTWLRWRGGQIA